MLRLWKFKPNNSKDSSHKAPLFLAPRGVGTRSTRCTPFSIGSELESVASALKRLGELKKSELAENSARVLATLSHSMIFLVINLAHSALATFSYTRNRFYRSQIGFQKTGKFKPGIIVHQHVLT
jgi:hypothetical protein